MLALAFMHLSLLRTSDAGKRLLRSVQAVLFSDLLVLFIYFSVEYIYFSFEYCFLISLKPFGDLIAKQALCHALFCAKVRKHPHLPS